MGLGFGLGLAAGLAKYVLDQRFGPQTFLLVWEYGIPYNYINSSLFSYSGNLSLE